MGYRLVFRRSKAFLCKTAERKRTEPKHRLVHSSAHLFGNVRCTCSHAFVASGITIYSRVDRACLGALPDHRLNACVNELTSSYPSNHAIVEIDRPTSLRYCLAKSYRSSCKIPEKLKPSAASRRASVRRLKPSALAISSDRIFL